VPVTRPWGSHVYCYYVVQVPERDRFRQALEREGIGTNIHYPIPLHLQPACARYGYTPGMLPVTEAAASRIVSLPMYPELTEEQIQLVVEAVRRGAAAPKRRGMVQQMREAHLLHHPESERRRREHADAVPTGRIVVKDIIKKMRELHFGVLGWGYWGPKIARNLNSLPLASVTMVADLDESRLVPIVASQPWILATTQVEEIFRSDVDAMVIATPVKTHHRLARAALLHGKHVLVEKPLTASVAEAEELVELAKVVDRTLMVGHTFEYSPAVNELRRMVQNGDLGKIYCVETERVNLGLFRNDINVIWDLASHDISILLYLFGKAPEHVNVQAHAHLQPHISDIAHLDLSFAGEMTAHIHVSWLHPYKVRRVTIIGDARMVVYDDTNPAEMIKIYNKGADVHADPVVSYRYGAITIPHIDWIEPLRLECEDFANAIRTGAQPRAHGGVGLAVVKVLAAAQEALESQEKSGSLVSLR